MPAYSHGQPCWIELSSNDVDTAAAFYSDLFGWKAKADGDPASGYTVFQLDGNDVAGLRVADSAEQPAAWLTCVAVDSTDTTLKAAEAAGGRVILEPMNIPATGRFAAVADRAGAVLCLWEAHGFDGFGVAPTPPYRSGAYSWAENLTRDANQAKEFYPQLFGWTVAATPWESSYSIWSLGGRQVAGLMEMNHQFPDAVPSYWNVVFAIDDVDRLAAKVTALGGGQTTALIDLPVGRAGNFVDPHSTPFTAMQYAPVPAAA